MDSNCKVQSITIITAFVCSHEIDKLWQLMREDERKWPRHVKYSSQQSF